VAEGRRAATAPRRACDGPLAKDGLTGDSIRYVLVNVVILIALLRVVIVQCMQLFRPNGKNCDVVKHF